MDSQDQLRLTVRDNEVKFCDKEGNLFDVTPSWENYDCVADRSFEYFLLAESEKVLNSSRQHYERLHNLYAMKADSIMVLLKK